MSNETYTEANMVREQDVLPAAVGIETRDQTGDAPVVPDTGDLPILPKFRERAQAINWRAALSTTSFAAFLAAVAGIGCGSGTTSTLKPSPATPTKTGPTPNPFLVGPTTTFNAPAGRNFGPVIN